MQDHIALTIIRRADSDALSARPDAPVVDDGRAHLTGRREVPTAAPGRRALAAALRRAAAVERRWADRIDPVRRPATPAGC
ncbi:hypothetical protein [Phycicoccus sonneratiae]|uniref:Uncharacterized protein n=1 Tax=Phycicoccus sonneratiae TaxID=2807628 RepID=A0ABS2CLN7_9MICO|nr:hypothetical protein [Phycicoccus sonneraticus]MBM6400797.1 hypothetical protein [Phycicoccus sonneraticus]